MKLRLLASLLIFLSGAAPVFSQDFSNKGKDFWVGYASHVSMYSGPNTLNAAGGSQNMVLYFTSDQTANVTVTIPATGWTRNYLVSPNTVTESAIIPKTGTDDARLGTEGVSSKGIHITSDKPIVAYAHIYDGSISGATLLFPTNTLGQDYYTLGFTQLSNQAYSYPFAYVIATEDSTKVEVTLPVATQLHPAGIFTQVLQKGQVLNLMGQITGNNGVDLTGTRIRTVSSGTGGCKRIAVFCGTGKIYINCSASQTNSADNLIQQCFPSNAWGKKYITIPTKDMPNNFFRVMVSDPTTVVKLNGTTMTGLTGGRYYQFQSSATNIIESDKPVMVAEFITTRNSCNNTTLSNDGDPEMIYLSPVEQTINKITLNSTSHAAITRHYINVVMRTTGKNSFKLDGVNKASSFGTLPGDPSYSYFQFSTSAGIHTLDCDSGFNAIAYGYGSAESYGYNAGANVIDLYQYVSLQNQFATVNFPATCKDAPFKFSITLPYQPIKLKWDFSQNPNLTPRDSVIVNPPVGQTVIPSDSSFIKDGKTLYVYKLSQTYTFSAAGTYSIKVYANNPNTDGCSGEQEINYDVVVYNKPVADFTINSTGCLSDAVQFNDASNGNGRAVNSWYWDFGDLTSSTVKDPLKTYAAGGTFTTKLAAMTDIGCVSDTVPKTFTISSKPNAKFGVDSPRCVATLLSFTDSSVIASGTIVKWYWDFGNGNTLVNNTNMPVTQQYAVAGSYLVTLQVESNTGCKSTVFEYPIVIGPYPVPDFTMPNIVCLPDGNAQFTNTSTIVNGTGNQFSYQWQFGDGGTSTLKDPVHKYTSAGPFNVKLVVTSNTGCVKDTTKVLSNIYAQPHANFTMPAEICLRDSTTFHSTSTGAGQAIVKWRWSFGDGGTDTISDPKHLYLAPGNYQVKLYAYSDKGCISDTMPGNTTVNPLPVAAIVNSTPVCETKAITFTDQSLPNVGTLTSWYINYGDGNSSVAGAPFIHTYASAGSYTVRLAVQNSKGCKSDTLPYPIVIHDQPKANYIVPEVCLNDSYAQFTDSSYIADGTAGLFLYAWNFGDQNANVSNPNTSVLKNPTHKYTQLGPYSASVKVTSVYGCVDSISRNFYVNGSFPEADFEVQSGAQLCSNLPVAIKNKSTVAPGNITKVEIYWDYLNNPVQKDIDDVPSFDKVYTHKYPDFQQPLTKDYVIRFVAYSGATCTDVKQDTITVNASPKTQFITIPGICFDASPRQITQASETGGLPKASDMFSGNTPGISATGMFNPATAGVGTYTLQYLFVSTAGCRDSFSNNITVWPSPIAKFGVSNPLCEKNAVAFTDSSVANFSNIISWNWNFGDGITTSGKGPHSHTYSTAGTYTATLKVTTDSECVSLVTPKDLVLNALPIVGFRIPSICLPDGRGTFIDTSTLNGAPALFSHLWDFGDPFDRNPSTLQNGFHKYSAVGPYPVKLVITTQAGCIDSSLQTINTIYPQPKADFTVSPAAVCLGAPITFTDISNGMGATVNQWNWSFGDGSSVVTTQNPTRTYSKDSTYAVSLFIYNSRGCVSDTMTKPVTVYPFPVVNAGPDLFVLEGGYIILNPVVSGNDLHFKWTDNTLGYLDNDTLQRPKFTPGDDITYRLTVTARGGCAAFDEVFIKVLKQPVVPNAFSPNKDGVNDVWNIQYLESYPGCTIEVYDRYGQKVFFSEGYKKSWDGTVKGQPLPIGVYYYIINPKNGRKLMTGSLTILR